MHFKTHSYHYFIEDAGAVCRIDSGVEEGCAVIDVDEHVSLELGVRGFSWFKCCFVVGEGAGVVR